MVFKLIIAIIIFALMFFSAIYTYDLLKYSWKMERELDNNNATCYFERGIFNIPLARVCTYNNTLVLQRE